MRRVRVTLPASISDFGTVLGGSIGLALAIHAQVEVHERDGDTLQVETHGEGAGIYPLGLRHPVVMGMNRVFQHAERAVLGLSVRVDNHIPLDADFGAHAVLTTAGMICANNLLDNPLSRDQVIAMAVHATRAPAQVTTTVLGGLTAALTHDGHVISRALPVTRMSMVIALPDLREKRVPSMPDRVAREAAVHTLSRAPLLLEALRTGDEGLLAAALDDHIIAPLKRAAFPVLHDCEQYARDAGAVGVMFSGAAVIAFAPRDARTIAAAMETAFQDMGIPARTWIVPMDTQGVVVSVIGT
jgi:homoserine kinase